MSKKSFKLILLLLGLTLVTSACSISTTSTATSKTMAAAVDSSIFVSGDRGDTWRSMTAVPSTTGSVGSISDFNINRMTMDPEDNQAVYLATFDKGLYYTYNVTEGWNQVKGLPVATVNDVQVDPKSKCIIYAALGNRVYRSTDCTRTWTQAYFDNNTGVTVNAVAPGPFESKMMAATLDAFGEQIAAGAPLKRIGRPDDMAGVAIFLASRAGAYLTGAIIPVDGGIATVG